MRFKIDSMEVIKRRNKINYPCLQEWKHYDGVIMNHHAKTTNCTTPYQKRLKDIPICTTREKMKEADFSFSSGKVSNYPPPYTAAEKISCTFEEVESTGTDWYGEGDFYVGIYFYNPRFKEIPLSR